LFLKTKKLLCPSNLPVPKCRLEILVRLSLEGLPSGFESQMWQPFCWRTIKQFRQHFMSSFLTNFLKQNTNKRHNYRRTVHLTFKKPNFDEIFVKSRPGVDFTNILWAAFTPADPKVQKRLMAWLYFLHYWDLCA